MIGEEKNAVRICITEKNGIDSVNGDHGCYLAVGMFRKGAF